MSEYSDLRAEIAELRRRVAGMMVHGTVHEVDAAAGTVRLRLGDGPDGEPFLGPAIPYAQFAGALKAHTPPSVGQQMTMLSPGGDFRQAVAAPMTWSDENASPSDRGDANAVTFGSVRIDLEGGALRITVGGTSVVISGGGVSIDGDAIALAGAALTHNGKNVGDDHVHEGVVPGPAETGPPA
jgi:phage baseplate assembly protein gpV